MAGELTITNLDTGSVSLRDTEHQDDIVKFTGADTYVEGTILARDTADDKLIAYVKDGVTLGNGIPVAIITARAGVVATGAGDIAARVAVKGVFILERLVIDADGDSSNIDDGVKDELRDSGLAVALTAPERQILDNQ